MEEFENNIQEPKKKKSSVGLIIVLVLVIIGLVGYICYDNKLILNNKTETKDNIKDKETTDETKEPEQTEETEITDSNTMITINNKIYCIVEYCNDTTQYNASKTYGDFGSSLKMLKQELNNEDKQRIALRSSKWSNLVGEEWKNNSKMKEYIERSQTYNQDWDHIMTHNYQIEAEQVDYTALKMFGSKITNPVETIGKCPLYIYDANQKMYFSPEPACGGTSASAMATYVSKMTKKEDNLYVYMSVGYINLNSDDGLVHVYKDFNYTDEYYERKVGVDEIEVLPQGSVAYNYVIDSSNYEKFAQFKLIFKQDTDGNYFFVKTEQLS